MQIKNVFAANKTIGGDKKINQASIAPADTAAIIILMAMNIGIVPSALT
ncbi:hypothetical protein GHO27_29030, partial [Pseudomonas helleri]|nr:hypothetical protein [Pseudomonas helleri]